MANLMQSENPQETIQKAVLDFFNVNNTKELVESVSKLSVKEAHNAMQRIANSFIVDTPKEDYVWDQLTQTTDLLKKLHKLNQQTETWTRLDFLHFMLFGK